MPSNRGIPSTERDLMQMQNEAIRRVRDMQERSRIAVDNANNSLSPVTSRDDRSNRQHREPEKAEHIVHNEPQKRKMKSPLSQILHNKSSNSFLPFDFNLGAIAQSLDYEDFLLIGLIILLITEEADTMMILALVYILVTELEIFKE